jgi:Flp pilus assembly protein TadG
MRQIMMCTYRTRLAGLLRRRLSDFSGDNRGVSAVEFALLLPLMLTIYIGGIQVSQGISIDRKVTLTARTVADLVAQVSTIDTTGVNASLGASAAILAPYSDGDAKITVSVVTIDANGNAKIAWSAAKNATARATNSAVALPDALKVPSTSLVWGEVTYSYKPSIGYGVVGTMTLSDQIFMRPRLSETVTKT